MTVGRRRTCKTGLLGGSSLSLLRPQWQLKGVSEGGFPSFSVARTYTERWRLPAEVLMPSFCTESAVVYVGRKWFSRSSES